MYTAEEKNTGHMNYNDSQPVKFATVLLFLSLIHKDEKEHASVCSCFMVTVAAIINLLNRGCVFLPDVLCLSTCVHTCAALCVLVGVNGDSGLITTLILFSQRPLKLPPLHQVSVWLPGNQGSGVPERRCLFPMNDPPERGTMGGGEDERRKDTNW